MNSLCFRTVWCALTLLVGALAYSHSADNNPVVEVTPIVDANGVVIGWTAEVNKEQLNIDNTERAFRLNGGTGEPTVFTFQTYMDGKVLALRFEVKSGPALPMLLPEGLRVTVPTGTIAGCTFTANLLGTGGGAPASSSYRILYQKRKVGGYIEIFTISGSPVIVDDANDSVQKTIFAGQRYNFDVRNWHFPDYFGIPDNLTEPDLTPRLSVSQLGDDQNPDPDPDPEPDPASIP